MIKFAVMTFMYPREGDGTHEKLIKIIADAGGQGIEAFANHFMGDTALVELYQREMKNYGVTMPVMDVLANLAEPEGEKRREAYDKVRQGIDICESLESEIVHLAGCRLAEGQAADDGRKWIVEGLMNFADDVAKRGMTLAFEDFNPAASLICSSSDCLEILKQTAGKVKFVFDTGNFQAAGERAEDVFDQLIDYTCHFHFKDFDHLKPEEPSTTCRGANFGQGATNNAEIIKKAKKSGYSGWVALESYPQQGNGPEKVIPEELAVLKKMFAEA